MNAATAIIQFIGIVLFTSAVPNDPGVHAILPRIEQAEHSHETTGSDEPTPETDVADSGTGTPGAMTESTDIEEHMAVIIYRTADRLAGSGTWIQQGKLANGWEYVKLDGEQVQFLTNGNNAEPKVPEELPRTTPSCELADAQPTLREEYQAPYKAAAGVIDIPLGTLDACVCDTPDAAQRIDTTMAMNTEGILFVAAKGVDEGQAKSLALAGDAIVFVANVPPHYLFQETATTESPTSGEPHWQVYGTMLDPSCNTQLKTVALERRCDRTGLADSALPAQFNLIDSSCSNTQFP